MLVELLANEPFGASEILYCIFDMCALVLITIIFFNYYFSKRVKNSTSKLYFTMVLFTIGATIFDMFYLCFRYVFKTPTWLFNVCNILFYLTYIAAGIVYFVYTVAFIYERKGFPKAGYVISNTLFITALTGIILAAVCEFGGFAKLGALDSKQVYESIIFASQLGAITAAMITTVSNRNAIRLHHRLNVYVFLVLNIVAAVLQQILRWHVCAFALSIASLLIYITVQRPEENIDSVTGMFNAKTFGRRFDSIVNSGKNALVFVLEIDNIAVVNSTFGMHGGNEVIREASARLKSMLGKNVVLYRLGGVRFAIIFNNEKEYNEFVIDYPRLFEEPFTISGTKMRIAATACVISIPDTTDKVADIEEIIRYFRSSAKTSDKVLVADSEVVEKSRRRERVDYAIQRAIKNRSFEVYYQPIYSVKNKRINSCEALIRLNDPDLGFISPDEFIPIAEQKGRIVEVGKFVMGEVCKFLSCDNPMQYGLEFVDVNLSVIQCMHPEIVADIDEILKLYGVPRRMVNLEVTETASAQSYMLLQSRLTELHQSGFTISLDDFGSGFSSVEYLIKFPFDVVKLDKSLVWAYMSTKKYEPILKHYMPMLHGLGTKIVAEGVETEEMVKELQALGCDYLQGFYYSKPVPKDVFLEYIKKAAEDERTA